ncbi:MAG TPA: hypothetical protein VKF40_00060 [Burkholderiales bacterium]|nr:hypothetical protein [Burkholderiales bacterium]
MISKHVVFSAVFGTFLAAAGLPSSVMGEDQDPAALGKALSQATVSLEQGLKASEREGKPISAKFEIEHGALQLSVYTEKGGKFSEVIVDHKSGSIKKSEVITDADDLKHAKVQSQAMAKAPSSLEKAVQAAVKDNGGFRAVSAMPESKSGQPVAEITLMKGTEVKKVTKKLE